MKKNFFKNMICTLGIHFPRFISYNFRDQVSGEKVNNYECNYCGKVWMATKKYSFFKVDNTISSVQANVGEINMKRIFEKINLN